MIAYGLAFLCVFCLAIGQILFKLAANLSIETGSYFSIKVLATVCGAMLLYFFCSLAWVWILRGIDLGKVYPLMALSFVMVPIGSALIFDENFTFQYYFGIFFIVIGIIVVVSG